MRAAIVLVVLFAAAGPGRADETAIQAGSVQNDPAWLALEQQEQAQRLQQEIEQQRIHQEFDGGDDSGAPQGPGGEAN